MRHDPDRLAARFLDGQMRRPERWRYERHLVECAACWTQVWQARAGRSAAESLRVVAPARVRERVRATPELDGDGEPAAQRRRRPATPMLLAIAAVLAAVLVGVITRNDGARTEDAVTDVAAAYRDTTTWAASTATPPARALAGLRWIETRVTTIDEDRVFGYRYADSTGSSVLVVQREGAFATPRDAQPVRGGEWVTDVDGVTIFCTDPPDPYLVVGTEPGLVSSAARLLTEHES